MVWILSKRWFFRIFLLREIVFHLFLMFIFEESSEFWLFILGRSSILKIICFFSTLFIQNCLFPPQYWLSWWIKLLPSYFWKRSSWKFLFCEEKSSKLINKLWNRTKRPENWFLNLIKHIRFFWNCYNCKWKAKRCLIYRENDKMI